MAEDEEVAAEGGDGEAKPARRLSRKKLLIIALPVLLLIGGGAAAFFLMGGEDPPATDVAAAEGAEAPEPAPPAATGPGVFYDIPAMLVNLSVQGQRQAYLRVAATLELASLADLPDAREKAPAIVDGFQTFLREMRPQDIAGSGGLLRLKEELVVRANVALGRNAVRNVLLTEFLVQ